MFTEIILVFVERHVYVKIRLNWLLCLPIYVPIVMYGLRLFIVVLKEIPTFIEMFTAIFTEIILVCLLKSICMPRFVSIGCCVSELHAHLCPYRNVWSQVVYCCFTRNATFTELFTCYSK